MSVGFAADTVGEPRACKAFFLGDAGIVTGAQTVTVNRVNDSYLSQAGFLGIAKFSTQSPFTSVGGGTISTGKYVDLSTFPASKVLVR